MIAPCFIKVPAGYHPDHGEPVDYTAGQLLPEWLAERIESGEVVIHYGKDGQVLEFVKKDGGFKKVKR
jgi:hypothetical protein